MTKNDKKHLTDQRFTDLDLIDALKQGVADAGFEYCTPIQASSLPLALTGKDVAGQAQTGTGKTVAFLLACCQQLITQPADGEKQLTHTRALILAPTRELAIQIYKDAIVLAKHTGLKLGLIYGGTGYDEQKQMLAKGTDILIGTPGRLIDFYKQNLFGLKCVQVVVLDEADRMFDLGFIQDIRYLLRRMPKPEKRLNMLFSATLSFRVMELAYEHMNNPEEIKINAEDRVADKIDEYCYYPADEEKSILLINLLRRDNPERVLVFVNTRYAVDEVSRILSANNVSNAALSGDVPQRKRESLLERFKDGKYQVLVATDVAARGLHIPQVGQVFNYDLPQDAEDYIHRIGRTARAGQSGEAISFICEKYAYSIMEIESFIGHTIQKKEIQPALLTPIEKIVRQYSGKNFAKNKSTAQPKERKINHGNDDKLGAEVAKDYPSAVKKPVTVKTDLEQNHERQNDMNQESVKQDNIVPLAATPVATQSNGVRPSENQQAPTQATQVPVRHDNKPMAESKLPEKTNLQTDEKTPPAALPKNRFSRRFGEIPLIG